MPSPINLQLGWPTSRLFPAKQLAAATASCLANPSIANSALIYGPNPGYTPLRESIAKWLLAFYRPKAGEIPVDRIAITGGASQNLATILQVFSDPHVTQRIWMVEPTYFLACAIFQDAGFAGRLRGVPEDEHGTDIAFFREALMKFENDPENKVLGGLKANAKNGKVFRHILYLTPTFSNPSAKTMSTSSREKLLALAREFDILIVSDDVYDWLRWPAEESSLPVAKLAPVPPRFVDLDRATSSEGSWGNCISNGSFSKIVAPGVRVGWAEASSSMISSLSGNGATSSGGAPSHLTSTFIHHLLDTGALQTHIDKVLIPIYQARYRVLMAAIKTHLEPLGVRVTTGVPYLMPESDEVLPAGGFFTYVTFPSELPTADIIAQQARSEQALIFAYGQMFAVAGDDISLARSNEGFGRGARLCWAWHEEAEIEEGIKRLGCLLRSMLTEVDSR